MTSQQDEAAQQGKAPPAGGKPPAKTPPRAVVMITIIIGVGVFLAGLIATIVSYSNAQDAVNSTGTEQHWTLWWGPMLFGAIIAIGGLVRRANTPAEARHEPGWYADPAGQFPQRWWDGTTWTAKVRYDLVETQDPLQDADQWPKPLGLRHR
jgi:Protein of unknown function (DUF2510)